MERLGDGGAMVENPTAGSGGVLTCNPTNTSLRLVEDVGLKGNPVLNNKVLKACLMADEPKTEFFKLSLQSLDPPLVLKYLLLHEGHFGGGPHCQSGVGKV
jgi:hypothetical protein